MRIRYLRDYPGTGNKAGDVVEVEESFGRCMLGASYAQEAPLHAAKPVAVAAIGAVPEPDPPDEPTADSADEDFDEDLLDDGANDDVVVDEDD